jgi:hypothetical protein
MHFIYLYTYSILNYKTNFLKFIAFVIATHLGTLCQDKFENIRKNLVPFSILFYLFSYLWDFVSVFTRQEMGFSACFRKIPFHPELIRIYSLFHPMLYLREICLEINMSINLIITNYAC